ncbi:hypothetical protein GCM10023347_47040 [Streptomyces chumphonensis]
MWPLCEDGVTFQSIDYDSTHASARSSGGELQAAHGVDVQAFLYDVITNVGAALAVVVTARAYRWLSSFPRKRFGNSHPQVETAEEGATERGEG